MDPDPLPYIVKGWLVLAFFFSLLLQAGFTFYFFLPKRNDFVRKPLLNLGSSKLCLKFAARDAFSFAFYRIFFFFTSCLLGFWVFNLNDSVGVIQRILRVTALVFIVFMVDYISVNLGVRASRSKLCEKIFSYFLKAVRIVGIVPRAFALVVFTLARKRAIKDKILSCDSLSDFEDDNMTEMEKKKEKMLKGAVELSDMLIRDIMTQRPDIIYGRADANVGEIFALMRSSGFSRIPIVENSLDSVVGFVYLKDLISYLKRGDMSYGIRNLLRQAYFVPELKNVLDLVGELRKGKIHIAVVVDEYGFTAGIVALEDIIEEVVGEIEDESDTETEPISKIGKGTFRVSGSADLDEVSEMFKIEFPVGGSNTIGGFLQNMFEGIPRKGDSIIYDGYKFLVDDARKNRIKSIRITKVNEQC